MITHYDLFAGIGGFSLALERVFYDREIRHVFVERDDFCRAVLQKHWPDGEYYEDIRDFNRDYKAGIRDGAVILTGGFPCQPFSGAGKRKGAEDDRFLWPEMLRSIQAIKPDWIIAENVAGLLSINGGLVFEQVCLDLENQGYEVQSFIIPACAKNAPHRRDRIWFIANTIGDRLQKTRPKFEATGIARADSCDIIANTIGDNARTQKYTNDKNRAETCQKRDRYSIYKSFGYDWNSNWYEIATKFCRVDDGLPKRLDRTPRLKALGNAIVPQIAEEIFKGIKKYV